VTAQVTCPVLQVKSVASRVEMRRSGSRSSRTQSLGAREGVHHLPRGRRVRTGYKNLGREVRDEMGQLRGALEKISIKRRGAGVGPRGGGIDSPTGVVGLQMQGMGREKGRLQQGRISKAHLEGEIKRDMRALKISRSVAS